MTEIDPLLAVVRAHREAWDAFQIAPDDEADDACCAMADALDTLVSAACAFPILSASMPDGTGVLLDHIRWWLAEEAEFAAGYQPEYGILQARAADLSAVLEAQASDDLDPMFAAIATADAAAAAHTASLTGLDESDDAQMCRANAAADAASTAFVAVEETMPTTWGGLFALVEFYGRDLQLYDRCSQGGGYFAHLAAAMRGGESKSLSWPFRRPIVEVNQAVASANPQGDFQASEQVAA